MTFSIRWLLGIVGIAAIFASGLGYHNESWAMAIVTLTIAVLATATLGVWMKRLTMEFWLPFAFIGWLYLTIAFVPANVTRLPVRLPGTQLALAAWTWRGEDPADERIGVDYDFNIDESPLNWASGIELRTYLAMPLPGFAEFIDVMQCLFALVLAGIAGVCSAFLLRRSAPRGGALQ